MADEFKPWELYDESGREKPTPIRGTVDRSLPWEEYAANRSSADIARERAASRDNSPNWLNAIGQGSSLGWLDEIDAARAGLETKVENLARGVMGKPQQVSSREVEDAVLDRARGRANEFRETNPVTSFGLELAGGLPTGVGIFSRLGARPGATGVGNVLRNSGVAAGEGAIAGAGYSEGSAQDRLPSAALGAGLGVAGDTVLRGVGGAAGLTRKLFGGASPSRAPTPMLLQRVTGMNPQASLTEWDNLVNAGTQPVLADVVGDTGQGVLRAAAMKKTPARQQVADFSAGRIGDAPAAISRQIRRLEPDTRRLSDIEEEIRTVRGNEFRGAMDAVGAQQAQISPSSAQVLGMPEARRAIQDAQYAAQNTIGGEAQQAAINELLSSINSQSGGSGEVRAIQDITAQLQARAQAAAQRGDMNLAQNINELVRSVRDDVRGQVPEYDQALTGFANASRNLEAAQLGGGVATGTGSDDFVRQASQLTPDQLAYARPVGARALETAADTTGKAQALIRNIQTAPNQRERIAALYGDAGLRQLSEGVGAVGRQLETARNISPRAGSQTAVNMADMANIGETAGGIAQGAQAAARLARGDFLGLAVQASDWLKSRGINDADAQRLIELALDPVNGRQVLEELSQANPEVANGLMNIINGALVPQIGAIGANDYTE